MLNIQFTARFLKDLSKHKFDKNIKSKILDLTADLNKDLYTGIVKPERLKYFKENIWSRHITEKHRFVYSVKENTVFLHSCYGHYDDK